MHPLPSNYSIMKRCAGMVLAIALIICCSPCASAAFIVSSPLLGAYKSVATSFSHRHKVNFGWRFHQHLAARSPAGDAEGLHGAVATLRALGTGIANKLKLSGSFIRLGKQFSSGTTEFPAERARPVIVDEAEIVRWLKRHGVCVRDWGWGKGCAKRPIDLLKELRNGESILSNGKRVVHVAKVAIRDGEYELVEARQVYKSGAIKERNRPLSEKFCGSESPIEAASRGIREELGGVVGDMAKVRLLSRDVQLLEEEGTSRSFPGLTTEYRLFCVHAEVEGLTRRRTGMRFTTGEEGRWDGKLHVWEWRKIESESGGHSQGEIA